MNIEEEGEIIRGMKILRTVPLAKSEAVRGAYPSGNDQSWTPTPPPQPPPPPTMVDAVAKWRRETADYGQMYSYLQIKLDKLWGGEKEGKGASPRGRARGAADAIKAMQAMLRPLIEGTVNAKHAEKLKPEIGRLLEAARTKAKTGDLVAMGTFDQLSDIHKQL